MKLESYVSGKWVAGSAEGRALINPVNGDVVAHADSTGVDMKAALDFARQNGGPALAAMSFAARGKLLRAIADVLTSKREAYGEIARINSGNTQVDAAVDIDGAIFTLKTYARLASAMGEGRAIIEPGQEQLAKDPVFFARHVWTTRPGVAVQVNAYNFPAWGMWEKVAVSLFAGVPSIAKPATATAWLAHDMMRDVIAANVVPPGVLSIVCGGGEGLVDALTPMDSLAFTGSADTGARLRANANVLKMAPRVTIEADSVNATIIGPDVAMDSPLFDLAVREIVKALSVKAGQLCTNIRRILVSETHIDELTASVEAKIAKLKIGDPSDADVRVGPLVDHGQRNTALKGIAALMQDARVVVGGGTPSDTALAKGAFVSPTLLHCADPHAAKSVHEIEVFGPCATLMPYRDVADAVALARRGGGSLALSLFSNDHDAAKQIALGAAPFHGRVLVVDEEVGKNHTGHSIVMPQCVHGGPGRAGGGEELGGLRGLRFHMQRTALQSSPTLLGAIAADACETTL